jgi:hypothetical protein
VNFIFREMTALRYYVPLVSEGNNRQIESNFYIGPSGKYNCPTRFPEAIKKITDKYKINLIDISEASLAKDIMFYIEDSGLGLQDERYSGKKVAFTYMNDFSKDIGGQTSYEKNLIQYYDHIIFPSEFYAKFHNTVSEKNLYLGSPKYDLTFDNEKIREVYGIPKNVKCALVVFPKTRDLHKIDLVKICNIIASLGYFPLIKNRKKDAVQGTEIFKYYFEDENWYPHTTMDLMSISDIVINFGSTTVKECVKLKKPFIDFPIKPHDKKYTLPFLYEYDYCRQLPASFKEENFISSFQELVSKDHSASFERSIRNHLWDFNSSSAILDFFYK